MDVVTVRAAADFGAGLVEMANRCETQHRGYGRLPHGESGSDLLDDVHDGADRDRRTAQLGQHLSGTAVGEVLADHQIHGQGTHRRAPTRRTARLGRERRCRLVPAAAATGLSDMVGHGRFRFGHIEDLTRLVADDFGVREVRSTAPARRRRPQHRLVGVVDAGQGVAAIAGLFALAPLGSDLLALTGPFLAGRSIISRWRHARVRGVPIASMTQPGVLVGEAGVLGLEILDDAHQPADKTDQLVMVEARQGIIFGQAGIHPPTFAPPPRASCPEPKKSEKSVTRRSDRLNSYGPREYEEERNLLPEELARYYETWRRKFLSDIEHPHGRIPRKTDSRDTLRARTSALSAYAAALANRDSRVTKFRERYLSKIHPDYRAALKAGLDVGIGGEYDGPMYLPWEPLALDQVKDWVLSQYHGGAPDGDGEAALRQAIRKGEGTELLHFYSPNPDREVDGTPPFRGQRVTVLRRSSLGELARLAEELAEEFQWDDAGEATMFVLTGEEPLVSPVTISSQFSDGSHWRKCRMTIAVDPVTSPEDLMAWYREARKNRLPPKYRPQRSEKHIALGGFWAERGLGEPRDGPEWAQFYRQWNESNPDKGPAIDLYGAWDRLHDRPWADLMTEWNRLYPDWAYKNWRHFAKDAKKGLN